MDRKRHRIRKAFPTEAYVRKVFIGTTACLTILAAFFGCSQQKAAEEGDTVRVAYIGTLNDSTVFDSTDTGDYIEFTIGTHQVIPGFETAVVGMKPGETKDITLTADQAYGPRRPELTHEMPMSQFPDSIKPEVGLELSMAQPNGQQIPIRVTDIKDDSVVVLDANHPLAGQTLNFKLTLVEIVPKEQ